MFKEQDYVLMHPGTASSGRQAGPRSVMVPDVFSQVNLNSVLSLQGIFFNAFFVAYIISPRVCHAFIGCAQHHRYKMPTIAHTAR